MFNDWTTTQGKHLGPRSTDLKVRLGITWSCLNNVSILQWTLGLILEPHLLGWHLQSSFEGIQIVILKSSLLFILIKKCQNPAYQNLHAYQITIQFCSAILHAVVVYSTKLCLTLLQLYGPDFCSWFFPGRILERVAISFSRGSSWPRDQTHVSCNGR